MQKEPPFISAGDVVLIRPNTVFKETSPLTKVKWKVGRVIKAHVTRHQVRKHGQEKTKVVVRRLDVEYVDENYKQKILKNYPVQHFAPLEVQDYDTVVKYLKQSA